MGRKPKSSKFANSSLRRYPQSTAYCLFPTPDWSDTECRRRHARRKASVDAKSLWNSIRVGYANKWMRGLLAAIKGLVKAKQYRIRIHAVRHMIEEGFDEENLLEALAGRCRVLEDYPNEERCLILGYFAVGGKSRAALHVVCDYSDSLLVDIVTAHLPQRPWWITPGKRGWLT